MTHHHSLPLFLAGALLLPACSTTISSARERDRLIADAFLAAVRPFQAALPLPLVNGPPLPAQTLADNGISVTVEGHLGAMQTRDGSWIVQVPYDASARLTAYGTTAGACGAALNVGGSNTFDVHTRQVVMPQAVVPGDALIVTSTGGGPVTRAAYWPVTGRSAIEAAMAVVFVPYAAIAGLLRPPAIGNGFLARILRGTPIPEAMIDMSRLPSLVAVDTLGVDWTAWGAAKPDFPYLLPLLRRFGGECYDGWSTDTRTPDGQHPGYGTSYASVVSQALVMLCSTAPSVDKRPLAIAITQRGLDLVGAFCDGRVNYPLGGHMQGRKALVVTCGHLLGIVPFADPTTYIGPRFQEDGYFEVVPAAWWFGGGWTAGWRWRLQPPFDGSHCSMLRPPGESSRLPCTTPGPGWWSATCRRCWARRSAPHWPCI